MSVQEEKQALPKEVCFQKLITVEDELQMNNLDLEKVTEEQKLLSQVSCVAAELQF